MEEKEFIEFLIEKLKKYKFLYISGNSGAGKSTLAKKLKTSFMQSGGIVNCVSMDDFIVDTTLRKNAKSYWTLNGEEFSGRVTSCCKEAYFLRNVETILYALKNNEDCYLKPKRKEIERLSGNAKFTIVEGIGSVFLPCDESVFKLWLECDSETELQRRLMRDVKKFGKEGVVSGFEERRSQFLANIEPFKKDFDLVVETKENNYSIK